jgi:hypothetical protein
MRMQGVWIEIGKFLDLTVKVTQSEKRYSGIALLVDRIAEKSPLLQGLDDALSISSVTGNDILIIVPHPGQDPRIFSHTPYRPYPEGAFSGYGLLTPNARREWAGLMWKKGEEIVKEAEKINDLTSEEVVESLKIKITESANVLRDYLGLDEKGLPYLVLLCLADNKAIVMQWSSADEKPYEFFKEIMQRSSKQWGPWLSEAVDEVAKKNGRKRGKPPTLNPDVLKGWETVCYLPRPRSRRSIGSAILRDPQFGLGIGVFLAGAAAVLAVWLTMLTGVSVPVWLLPVCAGVTILGIVIAVTARQGTTSPHPSGSSEQRK